MEQKRYLDYEGLRYVVEHLRREINTTEDTLRKEINELFLIYNKGYNLAYTLLIYL